MKRPLTLIVLAAAVALTVTLAAGSSGAASSGGGKRIAVFERATTDTLVDLPPAGDSLGDTLTFANEVFDARTGMKVGTDQGQCVRTVVGQAFECFWTTFLPRGQITVQGPFYDAADSTLAITGGTGAYRNARGTMDLHARSATEFDFVFHVIG
ncbi:MAG TPA: allene oxide cyclase family protein [Gaiellaceae bacterium]|nr:allene oxide cyclase family protein [Gaiellaceae bacterium]